MFERYGGYGDLKIFVININIHQNLLFLQMVQI